MSEMNEMNNGKANMEKEKAAAERKDADYSRYLAYQEALKSLRGNANGGR